MRGLPRLLFFGAVIGLCVWALIRLSPDRPTRVQAPPSPAAEAPRTDGGTAPWTQEDRAIWRETVDRRLMR